MYVSFFLPCTWFISGLCYALPLILRPDSIELFSKYKVALHQVQSQLLILCNFLRLKTILVEGKLTAMMARTMILPAALRYQTEVAEAVNAGKAAPSGSSTS